MHSGDIKKKNVLKKMRKYNKRYVEYIAVFNTNCEKENILS